MKNGWHITKIKKKNNLFLTLLWCFLTVSLPRFSVNANVLKGVLVGVLTIVFNVCETFVFYFLAKNASMNRAGLDSDKPE